MSNGNLNVIPVGPTQSGEGSGRRKPTRGALLDKMGKAMRTRIPISIDAGKSRPHDPVQAAKFASEGGMIVRREVPILTSWKDYLHEDTNSLFMTRLSVSACLHSLYYFVLVYRIISLA
jgi:hypothetical protein